MMTEVLNLRFVLDVVLADLDFYARLNEVLWGEEYTRQLEGRLTSSFHIFNLRKVNLRK